MIWQKVSMLGTFYSTNYAQSFQAAYFSKLKKTTKQNHAIRAHYDCTYNAQDMQGPKLNLQ